MLFRSASERPLTPPAPTRMVSPMPNFPTPARPSRLRRTGAALLIAVTCTLAMTAGPAMAAAPAGVESVAPLSASAYLNVPAPLVAGAPAVSTLALPRTAGTVITTSVAAKAAAAKKYANCTATISTLNAHQEFRSWL